MGKTTFGAVGWGSSGAERVTVVGTGALVELIIFSLGVVSMIPPDDEEEDDGGAGTNDGGLFADSVGTTGAPLDEEDDPEPDINV